MTTETDQTVTTNTLDETLQIIEISQPTLDRITQDIGWGELTQFTNAQVEQLQRIHTDHVTHGWAYIEAYLRQSALGFNVSPEEFDQLAEAINASGKCLVDYRDSFDDVLTRFCNGDTPEDCVAPQDKKVFDTPHDGPVTPEQLKEAASVIPGNNADTIANLIIEMAKGNAQNSCDTIVGFAQMGANDQERMRELYIETYQKEVCQILQSDAFKIRIEKIQAPQLGGNQAEQKKMLGSLIFGSPIRESRSLPSNAGSSLTPISDDPQTVNAIDTKSSNLPKES